jgi:hypothetical protein
MPFEVGRKKTGGRARGVPNRATSDFREKVLRSELPPIEFLCQIYRDPEAAPNLRLDAAKSVANFVYPKLSNVDINRNSAQPIIVQILRFSDWSLAA